MSLVGLIMIGGLVTQQIQTMFVSAYSSSASAELTPSSTFSWYLVGDVLVTVQQLWYHGESSC